MPETNDTQNTESPEAKVRFDAGKSHITQAAQEVKAAVGDIRAAAEAKAAELKSVAGTRAHDLRAAAEAKTAELREKAGHAYEQYRGRAMTLREDGEQYVRENPTKAILYALGVGFVLGLIIRR